MPRNAMLLGGPLAGQVHAVDGLTSLELASGGVEHTYAPGAGLPADVLGRLAPQGFPFEAWGYTGPDQAAVDQLRRDYPDHTPAEAH